MKERKTNLIETKTEKENDRNKMKDERKKDRKK